MTKSSVFGQKVAVIAGIFLMILISIGVNIPPAKAIGEPTFTIQYYSDSGLTTEIAPILKAGTYYLKITSDENLTGTPTIDIEAEGTANDVIDGTTSSVPGSPTIFQYTRVIANDAAAVGTVQEDISITATDAEEPSSNTVIDTNPTNEAEEAAYTDTITPSGSLQINHNAIYTNTNSVTLKISATDTGGSGVYQMRFSNNNSSWSTWQSYATSRTWNLISLYGASTTQGTKRAYVQFSDYAGNVVSYSDTIKYDKQVPTGKIKVNNGAHATHTPYVTLHLAGTDTGGVGVQYMRFSNNGSKWTTWRAYSAHFYKWNITSATYGGSKKKSTKKVYAQFKDRAGNTSGVKYDRIKYQDNKYIIIDLSRQKLYAYNNKKVVKSFLISSGKWGTPTPKGKFKIFAKTRSQLMDGPGYYLPNVQWISWFISGGYSIHGTYWHHNFGHPMSHGCINATNSSAKWIYKWAPIGTSVTVRS